MKKPTLLILAAGMGSRFGGVKQLACIGPKDEAIIDYSIYDAIRVGFEKIIFIVREDIANEVEKIFKQKLRNKIDFEIVIQKNDEPKFIFEKVFRSAQPPSPSPSRTKPSGTAHAILCAKNIIRQPFCVINADDFYGFDALKSIHDFLVSSNDEHVHAMIGYNLSNTLSDFGGVSRGICTVDEKNKLQSIIERKDILKTDSEISFVENKTRFPLDENTLVSMNIWGFKQSVFPLLEKYFEEFLNTNQNNLDAEFYIPLFVGHIIHYDDMAIQVISSQAKWFGITFKEDKFAAMDSIKKLIHEHRYPANLWM